ncbi:MAG: 8-amino-7-oxononanoate synthase [Phycisphaerales bacterium]|nr:8-amino-7-oxononanoate synthase [Phycisphaerales bacterium]
MSAKRSRPWFDRLTERLDERQTTGLWRSLQVRRDGSEPFEIDLSSNDYLRLASHPLLIERVRKAALCSGVGSGSSRLAGGTRQAHAALEARFAAFKKAEAALLFPTGYMANLAVLSTLAERGDIIVLDKLCHASLFDGARLAAAQGAAVRTFPHLRYERLDALLTGHRRAHPNAARFIVTDSVFSMDGDAADLPRLAAARDAHDACLIVDEAHATGVLGPCGQGLDSRGVADVTISTASKALGSLGGIVSGPRVVIDCLVNAGRSFIYTTAAPPTQVAAIDAALDVIEREPQRRHRLAELSETIRHRLISLGLTMQMDPTPIIPIHVGSAQRALVLAAHLDSHGILAPAIRPPTVAPNTARVRLSLHCGLTEEQVDRLVFALNTFDWSAE